MRIHSISNSSLFAMDDSIILGIGKFPAVAISEVCKNIFGIAKECKDFDYDLFFRSFAGFWKFAMTKQEQMDMINIDSHPLEYLRINYTLAQFDEFIATYGLKPGDGMYMDPSERILIW